jgi:hypothetical protein
MKDFQIAKLGSLSLNAKRAMCELKLVESLDQPGGVEIQAIEFRPEKD